MTLAVIEKLHSSSACWFQSGVIVRVTAVPVATWDGRLKALLLQVWAVGDQVSVTFPAKPLMPAAAMVKLCEFPPMIVGVLGNEGDSVTVKS